jgi:ATP-dependent protease ClpP protease subunit
MTAQRPADRLRQVQARSARLSRADGARAQAVTEDTPASSGELWLYGVVGGFWFGFDAESVARELRSLDVDELTVRLNSPGGNVIDGIAIGNLFRNHKARVTVVVDGLSASSASVLALGADEIVMSPGSQVMIHDASLLTYGNAVQLRTDADLIDKQSQNLASIYASRAGGSAEEWRTAMQANNGEGTWYTDEEAVSAGLADRVGTVSAVGSPPVAPVEELDDDEAAAAMAAWDLEVLVHPAARAAWSTPGAPRPPVASASGSITTHEGSPAVTFSDEQLTTMRQRLGVAEDADEATILAALDEALDDRAETPQHAAQVPEGMTLIETTVLDELRNGARQGTEARQRQLTEDRDRAIDNAIRTGRTTPARREHWQNAWDADPEGTRQTLEALAPGLVPVEEIGNAGDGTPTTNEASDNALEGFAAGLGIAKEALRG